MKSSSLVRYYTNSIIILLGGYFIAQIVVSMDDKMTHDIPLLTYVAYLINELHLIPYKEIFETSMPGTILFHVICTKLFGYGDVAFRIYDIVFLLIFLFATYRLMLRMGRKVSVIATLLVGISYMQWGSKMWLQKDFVGLAMFVFGLLFLTSSNKRSAFLSGVFFCLSFWMKPHMLLGCLVTFIYLFIEGRNDFLSYCKAVILGGFATVICFLVLLSYMGALTSWTDIFISYLPLHIQIGGDLTITNSFWEQRRYGLLKLFHVVLFDRPKFALASIVTTLIIIIKTPGIQRNWILYLAFMLATFLSYPFISGQFWNYHWMPALYFLTLLGGCIFWFMDHKSAQLMAGAASIILVISIISDVSLFNKDVHQNPKAGLVMELESFIDQEVNPSEVIQPIDWTGGAIHAMLRTKHKIATKFLYDYHFYHAVEQEYIQMLQKEYLMEIKTKKPEYILEVKDRPRIKTSYVFEEFDTYIASNYFVLANKERFKVYQKIEE